MILDEIVLHNFGVFRGRQRASLTPVSDQRPIILFGGLNGAGKTTLLEGLLVCLFGRHAPCLRGNGGYENYLRRSIHRLAPPSEGARLEIRFRSTIEGLQKAYCVTRSWKTTPSRVSESVDVLVDGSHDVSLSETWAERVDQFMPPQLAPLFFFDGEQIESLADKGKTKEMLATALHALLGIDLVDKLQSDLVVLEQRKSKERASEADQGAIDAADANSRELRALLNSQQAEVATLRTLITRAERTMADRDKEFESAGGKLASQRQELERDSADASARHTSVALQLVDLSSGALPLELVRDRLSQISAQADREAIAHQSQELREVIRERDERLRRRLTEKGAYDAISTLFEDFCQGENRVMEATLDVDQFLSLDASARGNVSVLLHHDLDEQLFRSQDLIAQADALQTRRDDLEASMAATPDSEAVSAIARERQIAQETLSELRRRLTTEQENLARQERALSQAIDQAKKLYEQQQSVQNQNEDINRFETHSTRAREVLGRFRQKVVASHLERLESLILDSFQQLLRKESLVSSVTIQPNSYDLSLHGQSGEEIPAERLSAGERQLLAVALLWALARASGRPLPVAIDTPLGRLDGIHRKHLVDRYFPYASHQVLIFSTDEEIDDELHGALGRRIAQTYRLEYDDETCSTRIEKGYFN